MSSTINNSFTGDGSFTVLDNSDDGGSLSVVGADGDGFDGGTGNGADGQSVTFGSSSLTLNPNDDSGVNLTIAGGNGSDDGNEGSLNLGGNGGDAVVNAGDLSMDSSNLTIKGGDAGTGDGTSDSLTDGSGGNASVSLTSLTVTSDTYYYGFGSSEGPSNFNVVGGQGGNDNYVGNGGAGGSVSVIVSGPVSVDSSSVSVTGGIGGSGNGTFTNGDYVIEGAGGSAAVSAGSLTITSNAYESYQNYNPYSNSSLL
jgi:hypothetical protein